MTRKLVKLVFSWDRPLQLWGLVKSLLDNTDLKPEQIRCLCKSSDEGYPALYDVVGAELGCKIVHQEKNLCASLLEQIEGAEFVSLAVDDMMYFRKASFAKAMQVLQGDPAICLWSWRIGANEDLMLRDAHWLAPHATAVMPYSYVFHTDGSLFRKTDLDEWLHFIPKRWYARINLNHVELYLAELAQRAREGLRIGKLHAGPLEQVCITWAINKVTSFGSAVFCEAEQTSPRQLRIAFENGARLDYSPLYGRFDWFSECGEGARTHVPATKEAAELFGTLVH